MYLISLHRDILLCTAALVMGMFALSCSPLHVNLKGAPFPTTFGQYDGQISKIRMETTESDSYSLKQWGYHPADFPSRQHITNPCFKVAELNLGSYVVLYHRTNYADIEGGFVSCK